MSGPLNPLSATAGAVPFINEKGQMSMRAVKVNRYVAGKMPEYCQEDEFEDVSENGDAEQQEKINVAFPDRLLVKKTENEVMETDGVDNDEANMAEAALEDRRLQRLMNTKKTSTFELLNDSDSEEEDRYSRHIRERQEENQMNTSGFNGEDNENDGEDDEENEAERAERRMAARERALAREKETIFEEPLELTVAISDDEEYVDYSDSESSEDDDTMAMSAAKMKPVFVRPEHRRTVNKTREELEREADRERMRIQREEDQKKARKHMIAEIRRQEDAEKRQKLAAGAELADDDDGEHDESKAAENYQMWRLRELTRIKRDIDERSKEQRQNVELARIRAMTEVERTEEFKRNPKVITNATVKGQMKFMQRYHHRGAYYVHDKEDTVFQRDFTAPTLEDNFDMLTRPKMLQVKNFGKAGRTKYTHLVDQDTTDFDAGWAKEGQNKFFNARGGGMKQTFEKPNHNRRE